MVASGGHTHALIPLYAVGVFIDFTISQAGMIRHWLRDARSAAGAAGWRSTPSAASRRRIVAVVVTTVKFVDGAWLVIVLIPVLVALMLFIRRQYDAQERELDVRDDIVIAGPHREQRVVDPGERHQPRGRPGRELRAVAAPTTSGRCT